MCKSFGKGLNQQLQDNDGHWSLTTVSLFSFLPPSLRLLLRDMTTEERVGEEEFLWEVGGHF